MVMGALFLFLFCLSFDLAVTSQLYHGPSLTLEKFNSILLTETTVEFGVRSLPSEDSEALWQRSLNTAWLAAESREAERSNVRSRSQASREGLSSFVICDASTGKQGQQSKDDIAQYLGDSMIPLYNKKDMSCFALQALPSEVKKMPLEFLSIPMLPEMKLQRGITDIPGNGVPLTGLQAMLCREGTNAHETILFSLQDSGRRNLRMEEFLRSRMTRNNQQNVWHRRLLGFEDQACLDMLSHIEVEKADATARLLTVTLPDRKQHQFSDDCLYSLIVELALHHEVCFLGALINISPRNSVASGIIQGEMASSTPFHDVGLDGKGQVVAVSDSGLDVDNCYFWDKDKSVPRDTSKAVDMTARKVVQYYAFSDGEEKSSGHGTHVAATIAGHKAQDGSNESEEGENGIAKGAKVAVFDIGNSHDLLELPPNLFSIFHTGYEINARVHTASWGSDTNYYTTLDQAVDAYISAHPDFLLVVAAGNLGDLGLHTVGSPAISKNALAVGATESTQPRIPVHMKGPNYLANFSSRGPTADSRIKPDICAPGIYLNSAKADPSKEGECDESGGLELRSGTSMAAPVVAGAATLVRQYFVEGWLSEGRRNPTKGFNPRASLIKAVLINGGQQLLGVEDAPGVISPTEPYDAHQGFGRVDLLRSLPIDGKNNLNAKVVNAQTIGNHGKDEYVLRIDHSGGCSEPLRTTLVWTDPIVAPFCLECTINDLDLYLTSGEATGRLFPNGLSHADTRNNVERIVVDNPKDDDVYTVHIEAKDLIGGQDYSLVITGCFSEVEEQQTEPICRDTDGDIVVNDSETKSCFWLAQNLGTFGYLCELMEVASRCQQTCDFCDKLVIPTSFNGKDPELYANVGLDGGFRWDGITFDMTAGENLVVTGLEIHTWIEAPYSVQVSTRQSATDEWTKVCNTTVAGKGSGLFTPIPPQALAPIEVKAGESLSWYITLDTPELVMQPTDSAAANPPFRNSHLQISQGSAVTYPTGRTYPGYQWNGRLWYQVQSTTNVNQPDCEDRKDQIYIDESVGERSCEWLATNMRHFGHVCSMVEQATICPKTCGVCYIIMP